jgi:hypothetical protein
MVRDAREQLGEMLELQPARDTEVVDPSGQRLVGEARRDVEDCARRAGDAESLMAPDVLAVHVARWVRMPARRRAVVTITSKGVRQRSSMPQRDAAVA